ncbi:MAG: NAD(P)/FAD-dependent oxidoreductase [Flavobacteriales bacterium]
MFSYWQKNYFASPFDVAVIGAGINGLLAASFLKKNHPALRVAVFEKGILPDGATLRNAGFACFGSMTELMEDAELNGREPVLKLLKSRYDGLRILRDWCGDTAIGYEACGGFEFFAQDEKETLEKVKEALPAWNRDIEDFCGLKDTFADSSALAAEMELNACLGLIGNPYEGAVNSAMLIRALWQKAAALGVEVYTNFELDQYETTGSGFTLRFGNTYKVQTRRLLFCTNGYLRYLPGLGDLAPARGQVLVTEPIPGLKVKGTFHHHFGYNYFRETDGRILLGGGRFLDREGETDAGHVLNEKIQDYLEGLLGSMILPGRDIRIETRWAGIMAVGESKRPIVKKLEENLYFAGRMGGMGVALGAHSAGEAEALIAESL